MKKTILALAFLAVAMVSCQDKTKDKVDDATEAIKTEAKQKADSIADEADKVADSTKAKAEEGLEKVGEETEQVGKEIKEASKK